MDWRGLTQESKHFCGYWSKTPAGKARWWIAYLFSAAPRFWFYRCRDTLRGAYVRWKRYT